MDNVTRLLQSETSAVETSGAGSRWCTGRHRRGQQPRRGVVLVAVMICLMVAVLLTTTLLRSLVARQNQLRAEQYQVQASWLAESALRRAALRALESADYQGEQWQIAAHELDNRHQATVSISVLRDDDSGRIVQIDVQAFIGNQPQSRAAIRRQLVVSRQNQEEWP